MRALFDDKKIVDLAEPFPDLGELRGKQFAKERTDADVREIIAASSDCSAVAGIIAVPRMIKRLLHEPGKGLRPMAADFLTNHFDQRRVRTLRTQYPTLNVQRSTFNWPKVFNWALNVWRRALSVCSLFVRTPRTNTHLIPPPGYRFRPPWYTRPEFYAPITVAAFVIGGLAILISMNLADLKNQAATFDLNKLEQMESASVILDRNDKILGQIYVENRETVPYEQLPRDLINAIVSVEDAKFYR